jgi:hypothetical protein
LLFFTPVRALLRFALILGGAPSRHRRVTLIFC